MPESSEPYAGSAWRHWDLHIHTPASYEHNFPGATPEEQWKRFIDALAKLEDVAVVGITDYFSLEGYHRVREAFENGELGVIEEVIPNIELRLDVSTRENKPVNIHILADPRIVDQLDTYLLANLECPHKGNSYSARREDIVRLGRTIRNDPDLPEAAAFNEGAKLFKVPVDHLRTAFSKSRELRKHALIALPNGDRDGVSGLRDEGLKLVRQELCRLADIIISPNPKDREHFLGLDGKLTPDAVRAEYGSFKPCIGGSDAHDLNTIGQPAEDRRTWIKADCTFEGLLQICYEPAHRVQISPNSPSSPIHRLERLRITIPDDVKIASDEASPEPFCLRGTRELAFSPGLTCVVGGRGSGKTTLLGLLEEGVTGGSAFFSDLRLQDASGRELHVSDLVQVDLSSSAKGVEFLRQNQIEAFALNQGQLTEAIFQRLQRLDEHGAVEAAFQGLKEHLVALRAEMDQTETLELQRGNLSALEEERDATDRLINSLRDERYTNLIDEAKELNRRLSQIRSARQDLEATVTALRAVLDESQHQDKVPDQEPTEAIENQAERYQVRLTRLIADLTEAVGRAEDGEDLSTPSEVEVEILGGLADNGDRVKAYLADRGISEENVKDLAEASERLARLGDEITRTNREVSSSVERLETLRQGQDARAREKVESALRRLIDPINDLLAEAGTRELNRISLRYAFAEDRARDVCIGWVTEQASQMNQEGRALRGDYVARLFSGLDWSTFPGLTQLISHIESATAGERATGNQVIQFLERPGNYHRFSLFVEHAYADVDKFKRIDILYDGKPLLQASFGQRCSAALIVLLMLGNTPIVIDEPEAHLDSALIADLLVSLIKDRKNARQIIFATHNANFVVNGDAELVHVLDLEGTTATDVVSTSLENRENRSQILRLEGGEDAFRQREERYGFRDRLPGVGQIELG